MKTRTRLALPDFAPAGSHARFQTAIRRACQMAIFVMVLGSYGSLATAAGSKPAPKQNAGRIFDYTDDSGTTHLTNVPAGQNARPYKVLVDADPVLTALPLSAAKPRPEIAAWILEAAREQHVESALIYAVMAAESGFNAHAVSAKGAAGLMQLMPETALRYGVDDRFDPRTSILGGTKYLRDLLDQFNGNKTLAIAAYNAGGSAVLRYHSEIPPFSETQSYVPRVLGLYQQQSRQTIDSP